MEKATPGNSPGTSSLGKKLLTFLCDVNISN